VTPHRAIALVFALHGAVAGSLATRIPWLQDHFDLSPQMLGFVLLCQPIGAFIAMPTASRLSYRIGGRTATRLLIAMWCAMLAVPALAPSPVVLFVFFALYGMAAGTSDVVMNAHGVALERQLGRSIIAGLHGMWSVGSLVAGGAGVAAAHYGVDARVHLSIMAAILLGAALAVGRGLHHDTESAQGPAPRRFALPTRAIVGIGLVGFCGTFAEGAAANWAAVYMIEVTEAGAGTAAAAYTVFMLLAAGCRLIADRFVRRMGADTVVRIGGLLAAAGGVIVVISRVPALSIVGFAFMGAGLAVVVPLVFLAASRAGDTPAEGVAGVATITYLSGLIAPAVTGWAAGAFSYPLAFAMITLVVVGMIVSAGALRPKHESVTAAP
jgi:fucose permease